MFDSTAKTTLESGNHTECLKVCRTAGEDYSPVYFDRNDIDWDTALHYLNFEKGPKGSYPVFFFENYQPDYDYPNKEIRSHARENPIYAGTEKGNELLEELFLAFESACNDHFDLSKEVEALIGQIHQKLAIFVPTYPGNEETIPQARISGCDEKSTQWKRFVNWCKNHYRADSKRSLDVILPELRDNASYGGEPGYVVLLTGKEFLAWMKSKDLFKVLRKRDNTSPDSTVSIAIYDFCNGSGHDCENSRIGWKKLRRVSQHAHIGIINNFIDSVFGIVGISKISIPDHFRNSGTSCYSNIWI